MKHINFATLGTFGDTVYSLCMVKALGGGNMYVKLDGLDDFARKYLGWRDAGPASGRYTLEDYNQLKPLLDAQDYLKEVTLWTDQPIDIGFDDHWKQHMLKGWQGNQTECYALAVGKDIQDPDLRKKLLYEPWLTPVKPVVIPGRPFVINRTERHLHGANGEGWHEWVQHGLSDYAVFVGSENEHAAFQEQFKITIPYHKTHDLLELAQVIQGCEQFMGNQSVALSIAIGLGKTFWCEVREDYEQTATPQGGYGDVWFPRINGFYF